MSTCPKCGVKLKLTDIDQCCPKCGVNMRLYGFETEFYKEAKIAELSQARYSCKIRRFKMSMIGTKLSKARLGVMLLPLLALLIPAGNAAITLPFKDSSVALSALGLFSAFTGGEFNLIMSLANGGSEAAAFSALRLSAFLIAGTAVFALLTLVTSLLNFLSMKKMPLITCILSALGIVSAAASIVSVFMFNSAAANSVIITPSNGFGLYVVALMFGVVFAVNLLIKKKGIPVEYPEGSVERSEIWEKVKAGEINIDDLPYPVVETEETRKIKEEIEAERNKFHHSQEEKEEDTNEET